MYRIPNRRASAAAAAAAAAVDNFPALCPAKKTATAMDFTKLSFEEEVPVVQERRFEPGWARLSRVNGKLHVETDYVHPEPSLNALMNKEILRMKSRWIKFYTDRGLEPYNYDYVPEDPVEDDWSEQSSSVGEDPDDYESE
jgi:hypothetical protein